MRDYSCDVIGDLLPSYLDGICSEATKQLVERHMEECATCRLRIEGMRDTQIVPEDAHRKEIDYMKKVKKQFSRRNRIIFWLLFTFLLSVFATAAVSYRSIPPELCYTGMPVLMLGCYFVITADTEPAVRAKARKTTGAISLLLTGYGVFLMFRSMVWIRKGVYPLGMQERQIGPFLDGLLLAIFFCQTVLFAVAVSLSLRTKRSYNLPLNFTLAGAFFCLAQRSMLSRMSDVEAFAEAGNRFMAVLLAETAAVMLLLCVLEKRKQNAVPPFSQ